MDCFLKSLYFMLEKREASFSIDEFAFLTNYSISEFWFDKKSARSFNIPVISNSRTRFGYADIELVFPYLKKNIYKNFEEYYENLNQILLISEAVVRLDRYYLDYIQPRAKMGAHFITIKKIDSTFVYYYDAIDDNEHKLSLDIFKKATLSNCPANFGMIIYYLEKMEVLDFTRNRYYQILQKRVDLIEKVKSDIVEYKQSQIIKNNRLNALFLKINLQNILETDFYNCNGRLENYNVFKNKKLKKIAIRYNKFGKLSFQLLGCKINQTFLWRMFLLIYIRMLGYEKKIYMELIEDEKNWEIFIR